MNLTSFPNTYVPSGCVYRDSGGVKTGNWNLLVSSLLIAPNEYALIQAIGTVNLRAPTIDPPILVAFTGGTYVFVQTNSGSCLKYALGTSLNFIYAVKEGVCYASGTLDGDMKYFGGSAFTLTI